MLPDPTHPTYPSALHTALKERGMTGGDLARAVGTTRSAVSYWLTGLRRPGPKLAAAILVALASRPKRTPLRWPRLTEDPPTPAMNDLLARVQACWPGGYIPHEDETEAMTGLIVRGMVGWTGYAFVCEPEGGEARKDELHPR